MNAIKIQNLIKTYSNGTQALKGIDLNVSDGDFFALLGANGAGKTTIIGILTSIVNKTAGEVEVFGHNIDQELNEAKRKIGVVPQEFNFSIFERVIDIVTNQGGYYGIPYNDAKKNAEDLISQLGLWNQRFSKSMSLSGGMKRRLMIARALVHKPKLLLLDEPTAGVDVELRHETWQYMKNLNKNGTTIVLTTHYLEEVEQLCRNVAMIKSGVIVKNDSVKNILAGLDSQIYVLQIDKALPDSDFAPYQIESIDENTIEIALESKQTLTDLAKFLDTKGLQIIEARTKNNRMEQIFLNLLQN